MGRPVGRPIRAPGRRPRVRTLRVMADDLLDGSLEAAARALRDRAVSARELTDACLARIERLEPTLNAFITLTAEPARERARQLDDGTAARSDRPLRGIPVALKDLFDVAGVVTTAGSRLLAENVAPESATAVAKLEDAGVVELGKLNLHEWAFGVTTDNPHYGPTRNPWAPDRIPGGSSGGSATALAAGMCFGSLGSDTGGSIRIPAALCGVVGLKPTRGRISLRGVVPLSWTLDHAGPMARTVRDAAILLQAIAGHDPLDPASVDVPVGDHLADLEAGVRGLRIGVARDPFFGESAQAVADAVDEAVGVLESEGARIEEVALPRVGELREAQGVVLGADAAAYHRERFAAHPEAYGRDVAQRLRRGLARRGTEYARARRLRAELRIAYAAALAGLDALALPTTPITAPLRIGQDAVAAASRLTAFTSPFNFTGLPAISVPCGVDPDGLPIGLQLAGAAWSEARLLRVARAYERATGWHERRPPPAS